MDNKYSKKIIKCQICGEDDLASIIFLGFLPPVNSMREISNNVSEEVHFPLELRNCSNCSLVQIGTEVNQDILFPESYPYLSNSTKILRDNFTEQADVCSELLALEPSDLVIDIGSNDGTLLRPYSDLGFRTLGIEPSQAADIANSSGIQTIKSYFDLDLASDIKGSFGSAKLVTACNVFAHIPDVHSLLEGIISILGNNGVFLSENHYLLDLVEGLQYDTIYHEHLRYYSLHSLVSLFEHHELEIFDVQRIKTHGGSIRVFACRKGERKIENSVFDGLEAERKLGLNSGEALKDFSDKVLKSKLELLSIFCGIKSRGESIVGVGAPSRASTLISYVGIDDKILDYVAEISSSHKLDKFMPGTKIPVLDEEMIFQKQPEYLLLLSWHIKDDLIEILRKKGFTGKFIVPLPFPTIVE